WGFPVIRYRTGDAVIFNQAGCDCGRTFLRLEGGVLGRVDDMITIRGVNVFPSALENLIRAHATVDEFRVRVGKRGELDELSVEVELMEGSDADAVVTAVAQSIGTALGFRPTVTAVPRDTLPRFELKAKRFQYFGT
ncbi:MAG: phenylacetate--CoA ligase family protein, partial [Chloroflexi bacterium]|nr:phenylacetate--CoA ligase family protein [Chloroflexota bacterium]